jgi:beta-aspartyl-peptidase (threonine type)
MQTYNQNSMKKANLLFSLFLVLTWACSAPENTNSENPTSSENPELSTERPDYAIVIHGGAGYMRRDNMTPEREKEYINTLNEALDIGEKILKDGGSSMDAIEQTIMFMENSPMFNSGKGAVFTYEGRNELDASFMEGKELNAGAVGGVTVVKNPIRAARAVMEKSPHVLMVGKGAEAFAISQGLDTVPNSYFYTEDAWNALQRVQADENKKTGYMDRHPDYKYGTVGCVALDKDGNISAGTSTGGMTNKRFNRIGDSPIIAAGTYANNNTCGVSCTGHGEYFIRYAVAYDVSALMDYKGLSVKDAANYIINDKLKEAGGAGGLIALDQYGNIAMPFNTSGMFRGYAKPNGERVVGIFGE